MKVNGSRMKEEKRTLKVKKEEQNSILFHIVDFEITSIADCTDFSGNTWDVSDWLECVARAGCIHEK